MRLYQGNAKELVGKKIDLERRIGGYYPMEVIEIDGILYVKDAVGVCMPIPDKEDDFNSVHFDFIIKPSFSGGKLKELRGGENDG